MEFWRLFHTWIGIIRVYGQSETGIRYSVLFVCSRVRTAPGRETRVAGVRSEYRAGAHTLGSSLVWKILRLNWCIFVLPNKVTAIFSISSFVWNWKQPTTYSWSGGKITPGCQFSAYNYLSNWGFAIPPFLAQIRIYIGGIFDHKNKRSFWLGY